MLGYPALAVAALHGGWLRAFVNERVRNDEKLRGRRVGVSAMDALEHTTWSNGRYVG